MKFLMRGRKSTRPSQRMAPYQIQIAIKKLLGKELKFGPFLPSECCIYKVPEILRNENEDAYSPYLISIGPTHYGNPKLEPMEKQKALYLDYFSKRDGVIGDTLVGYWKFLNKNEIENKIRNCYSEKYTKMDKNEFVGMIGLDAVFIMELFLRNKERNDGNRIFRDCIFSKSWLCMGIKRDLLLAENQLPFFILMELYERLKRQDDDGFLGLVRKYFQDFDPYENKSVKEINGCSEEEQEIMENNLSKLDNDGFLGLARKFLYHGKSVKRFNKKNLLKEGWDEPKHFTDLIRSFYIPPDLTINNSGRYVVKSATKFKGSGLIFEHVSNRCLLDITFKKRRFNWFPFLSCLPFNYAKPCIQIPKLEVDDSTEDVLRNLIAFEQCQYPEDHYICSYVSLLDLLIREEKDAAVLVESGVIVNHLNSGKNLATLLSSLCKNIVIYSSSYGMLSDELSKELKEHNNFWNTTKAELESVYFRNLWTTTGTIVGLIILFITVFDFVRSNIKYFKI